MKYVYNHQSRGCPHAEDPLGCRGGRWVCGCGWKGHEENCGNNAAAQTLKDHHAVECPKATDLWDQAVELGVARLREQLVAERKAADIHRMSGDRYQADECEMKIARLDRAILNLEGPYRVG